MACCGLSPKASKVLPIVHAEMLDPDTVQYAESMLVCRIFPFVLLQAQVSRVVASPMYDT